MPNLEQSNPTRPKRIHELENVASVDITGDTDLLVIDRLANGDWTNYQVTAKAFADQVMTATLAQTSQLPSEITASDTLVFEDFTDYAVGSISALNEGFGWVDDGTVTNASIVSRLAGNYQANRLSLANSELIRKMPWAGKWQRIWIGLLLRINAGATFTSNWAMGICSGQANTLGAATCDNFFGLCGSGYAAGGTNDHVFTAGTRGSYFVENPALRYVTKRGTTKTDRTGGSGSTGPAFAGATEGLVALTFLDISRPVFATDATSVTYSFARHTTTATGIEFFPGKKALWHGLTEQPSSTVGGQGGWSPYCGGSSNNTLSFAFDQSTGVLDTFNFLWPHTSQPLEILAYGIRRIF